MIVTQHSIMQEFVKHIERIKDAFDAAIERIEKDVKKYPEDSKQRAKYLAAANSITRKRDRFLEEVGYRG